MNFDFDAGEILLIDKPLHWTSFNVVAKVRNAIKGGRKVGHAGTLDPLATGLLILCTGKATKKIEGFLGADKTYTGTFQLGITTPSYDFETEPDSNSPFEHITEEQIRETAASFLGESMQRPPDFSAIKVNGKRAYEGARKGHEIDIPSRLINLYEFEITGIELPYVHFKVKCTKGTYIRSLANDFGKKLGCGAALSALRRTASGDFLIENSWNLEELIAVIKAQREQQHAADSGS